MVKLENRNIYLLNISVDMFKYLIFIVKLKKTELVFSAYIITEQDQMVQQSSHIKIKTKKNLATLSI